MIEAYSTNITVEQNASIPLNNVSLILGDSTTMQGAATIRLNKRGIYKISINASAATSATAGNVTVQLRKNGILQPQALSIASSTSATDIVSLSFVTLVQVTENSCNCPCSTPTVIDVVNTGVDSDFAIFSIKAVRV